jgi:hypothetical protein
MGTKHFRLTAAQIKPLANGHGGCLATDRVVVDGQRVGYMYRELPDSSADSGWRFFAGDESDDYVNDPQNLGIYDVNTIANYDPLIIPLLSEAVGAAFARDPQNDQFVKVL